MPIRRTGTVTARVKSAADPVDILIGPERGAFQIRFLCLYNPNAGSAPFTLSRVTYDIRGGEISSVLFKGSIPAADAWYFGTWGGLVILESSVHGSAYPEKLTLVFTSEPAEPIQVSIDYGWDT